MKTRLLPADAPGAVEEAATALANGELVAFPTDTVYGLAAGHDHLRKLYIAKDRPKDKRIPILLSDAGNLETSAMVTPAARALAARFWPGPLTLILVAPRTAGSAGQTRRRRPRVRQPSGIAATAHSARRPRECDRRRA